MKSNSYSPNVTLTPLRSIGAPNCQRDAFRVPWSQLHSVGPFLAFVERLTMMPMERRKGTNQKHGFNQPKWVVYHQQLRFGGFRSFKKKETCWSGDGSIWGWVDLGMGRYLWAHRVRVKGEPQQPPTFPASWSCSWIFLTFYGCCYTGTEATSLKDMKVKRTVRICVLDCRNSQKVRLMERKDSDQEAAMGWVPPSQVDQLRESYWNKIPMEISL